MKKSFFARYYAYTLKKILRRTFRRGTFRHSVLWAIGVTFFFRIVLDYDGKNILMCTVFVLTLSAIYLFVYVLIRVSKSYSLYKILDENGYCPEYLHAFEQKRFTGKPLSIYNSLEYAEIFMRIGKPNEAIKYLNTLTFPPNASTRSRSEYFYLYVLSALKMENLALADDMWNRSGDLISKISVNTKLLCARGGYKVIIAMILTDCFAAQQNGDRARLERAFQQTEDILINPQITDRTLLQIIRLYELRELGFTEHYNSFLPKVREEINASEPLFHYIKDMQLENLSRVENGMLPFQSPDEQEKRVVTEN